MIKRKKKICKKCGKDAYLFGLGMCQRCYTQFKATESYHKGTSRKSNTKIPPRTKKRLEQEKLYHEITARMDEQKNKKCFFCGKGMKRPEDHHHLKGRDGDLLTDPTYIVHVHRDCHFEYHYKSVIYISWFKDYLGRLKDTDMVLYERDKMKLSKL